MPGQTRTALVCVREGCELQWRAEQLPGQTGDELYNELTYRIASMEGRAIARPNLHQSGSNRRPVAARFNGGPSNCPAKPGDDPDCVADEFSLQWRAEQLPGQTTRARSRPGSGWLLQWRAEQLPGQTAPERRLRCQRQGLASMEGRAIARPNFLPRESVHSRVGWSGFNGGPSNCPAKRAAPPPRVEVSTPRFGGPSCTAKPSGCAARHEIRLQWRAEQLPGQTEPDRWSPISDRVMASMEGRAIARPNCPCDACTLECRLERASMEGRAIARPNCPGTGEHVRMLNMSASMEGRAIARPNAT